MNQPDRLERDLSAWLADVAAPRTPDWTTDLIAETGRVRQRPRWTFPGRWLPGRLPGRLPGAGWRTAVPVPWRAIAVLAIVALLLATLALLAGSQRRLPEPFGPARNGLVLYAREGDIYTVDPATNRRTPVVAGLEGDRNPRWSLDGTRITFLRDALPGDLIVTAMADGSQAVIAPTGPLFNVDTESVAWSHDGRSIAVMADDLGTRAIFVIDAIDNTVVRVPADGVGPDMSWRPPDGRQLTFSTARGLFLFSLDTGRSERLVAAASADAQLRAGGWSPDGRRFAYHEGLPDGRGVTWVVEAASGDRTRLPLAFGQLSNDGTRVVGLNGDTNRTWLCVAPAAGGPCARISQMYLGPWGTNHRWSPDDQWILSTRDDLLAFAFDPDTVTDGRPAWVDEGAESWQRRAP